MHWEHNDYDFGAHHFLGMGDVGIYALAPVIIWSLVWKGWSLWLAARRGEQIWFIALLLINTVGILEIFYIFVIAKQKDTKETVSLVSAPAPQTTTDTPKENN